MTKAEYMGKLQEKLERFGREMQEEILEDYRQHFSEGENEGKSEEEIIEELGNIEDMISELSGEDLPEDFGKKILEATWRATGRGVQEVADFGQRTWEATKSAIRREWPEAGAGEVIEADADGVARRSFSYTGDYRNVVLEGKSADIYLLPSDDGQIHVDYEAKGISSQMNYEYYQHEEEGTFYAGVRRRRNAGDTGSDADKMVKVTLFGRTIISYGTVGNFGDNGQHITLTVKLPKVTRKLTAKTSSGNVRVQGVELEAAECTSGSGNVGMEQAMAERVKMSTGSGNVSVRDTELLSGSFGTGSGNVRVERVKGRELRCGTGSGNIRSDAVMSEYDLSTGSGNIKVSAAGSPEKVCLSTGSGSVRLELGEVTGLEAKVKSGSGNIHIAWGEEEEQKMKNGTYTYGDGACKVEAGTGSGSIRISRS